MAFKNPNKKSTKTGASAGVKTKAPTPKPKKEKKQSKGLFGFKKKSKKVDDDIEDINEEIEEIENVEETKKSKSKSKPARKVKTKTKTKGKKKASVQDDEEDVLGEIKTIGEVADEQHIVGKSLSELDVDLVRYNTCLFLYATPMYYGKIQSYFESHHNVMCLGTTIQTELINYYQEVGKEISTIILFALEEKDLDVCKSLVKSLGLDALSPKSLQIYILYSDKLKKKVTDYFSTIKGIRNFAFIIPVKELSHLEIICRELISRIIQGQPSHLDEDLPVAPEPAKISKPNTTKNYMELIEQLEKVRQIPIKERYKSEQVSKMQSKILASKNLNEGIDAFKENSEVLPLAKDILDIIDEMETKDLSKEEVERRIQAKIYTLTLCANEIHSITSEISDNIVENMQKLSVTLQEVDVVIEAKKGDAKQLLEVRNKFREKLKSFYNVHAQQASVVDKTWKIAKAQIANIREENVKAYKLLPDNDTIQQNVGDVIKTIQKYNEQGIETLEKNTQLLKQSYDIASKYIEKSEMLLQIDDILIDSYGEIIKEQEAFVKSNAVINVQTERKLQEILRVIYYAPESAPRSIINVIKPKNSIILNINKTDKENTKFDEAIYYDFKEFIDKPIDDITNDESLVIDIDVNQITNEDINLLFSTMDYLTDKFEKLYVFIETINDDEASYPLEEEFLNITPKVEYFVTTNILNNEEAKYTMNRTITKTQASAYSHIVSRQVVLNKYVKSQNDEIIKQDIRSQLGLANSTGIITITQTENINSDAVKRVLQPLLKDRL